MFTLLRMLCLFGFTSQYSCYIFDVKYSYVYATNRTGYSTVFLQKHTDGFRLVVGAPSVDKLLYCYNGTSCQPYSLSVKNSAGFESFGAAIDGGHESGDPIYVCAPRHITSSQYRVNGRCFALHDRFKTIASLDDVYSQVKIYNNTYQFLYAHGQAGFSIKYVDQTDFLLGAPGVLSWKGTVIKHTSYESKDVLHPEKRVERNSYLGYSIEYANFYFAGTKRRCVIAGAPRGDNLLGQVYIFNYQSITDFPLKILKGEQISSYYGSSLMTTTNELFVGAPMYTTKSFEEGCVYVYTNYQTGLILSEKICGNNIGGRFGTSLTKIGYIGMEKNLGIAISAPYADNNRGIIYIYAKGDDGYKEIQQIFGRSVFDNVQGFGYTLSSTVDVDQNNYNDIAIGSLYAEHVIILRSKKILSFSAHINSSVNEIGTTTKNVSIDYCFQYVGRNAVDAISVQVFLEGDNRVTSVHDNRTVDAKIDREKCETFILIMKPHAFDSPLPLKIKITNKLSDCIECPVVFPKDTTITHQLPFATGCGEDNVCTPDLRLRAQIENISELVLGSRDSVTLTVSVTNLGETAYLCKMNMTLPTEISQFPAACSKINNMIYCDISNRVVVNQKKQLQFQFDVKDLDARVTELKVDIIVSSAGTDNGSHVMSSIKLPIILKSNVALMGFSNPDYFENRDNSNFTHEYLVFNSGPSPLLEERFEFRIPEGILSSTGAVVYPFQINPLADECVPFSDVLLRRKRDLMNLERVLSDVPQHIKYYTSCENNELVKCKTYHCMVGELSANFSYKFKFRIAVNASLFFDALRGKTEGKSLFLIESVATRLRGLNSQHVSTHTVLIRKEVEAPDIWMWILIAIFGSLLILTVITSILYKLNFFARPMRERLLTEEEQKNERQCMIVNDENLDDSAEAFNDIRF